MLNKKSCRPWFTLISFFHEIIFRDLLHSTGYSSFPFIGMKHQSDNQHWRILSDYLKKLYNLIKYQARFFIQLILVLSIKLFVVFACILASRLRGVYAHKEISVRLCRLFAFGGRPEIFISFPPLHGDNPHAYKQHRAHDTLAWPEPGICLRHFSHPLRKDSRRQ